MKRFRIQCRDGRLVADFEAETFGKAKYQAFKAIRSCGYLVTFREFVRDAHGYRLPDKELPL